MIGPAPTHPDDEPDGRPHVVFVCTGNAARSVMATLLLRRTSTRYRVTGSGTHVIEGQVMSSRTRTALARHDIVDGSHRSRQFGRSDLTADLILTMEPAHVRWIRKNWPEVADRVTSLKRAIELLEGAVHEREKDATTVDIGAVVAGFVLEAIEPQAWEEVLDPGAGEQPQFDACIDELVGLVDRLAAALP